MRNIPTGTLKFIAILLFAGMTSVSVLAQPLPKNVLQQQAFEKAFADAVRLDTAIVRMVKADKEGKRHYIDRNRDGKPEEIWFIDTDPRHTDGKRPILVRVIDEDNDMIMGSEPDLDSDLYIADWNANGIVDAVVDYEDGDKDNDVDQMGIYFYGGPQYGLRIWWGRDDGDDNLLWYDVDYTYYQDLCQYRTHFGGNESFFSMYLKPDADHWTPFFENPFLFFDHNNDGSGEEVIRVSGEGDLVLTANTAELQAFLRQHAANTNAFGEPTKLKRR